MKPQPRTRDKVALGHRNDAWLLERDELNGIIDHIPIRGRRDVRRPATVSTPR